MSPTALLARPLRLRWPLWSALAVVATWLARSDDPPDLQTFSDRGAALLAGHFSQVYADSWNQAGPLQLVGARLLLLGSSTGRPLFAVELAIGLALLGLLWVACRRSGTTPAAEFVLAGFAVVWLGPSGLWSGHPVEILIPLLWLAAAGRARDGRWLSSGAFLGLGALIAPWAILAAPIALAGRTRPAFSADGLRAIAVAVLVGLGGYLPFALSGRFGLFGNTWLVNSGTLVHLLAPDVVEFSWWLRLAQAVIVAGGCWLVVRHLGAQVDVVWAAPLAVVVLRVLFDPVVLGYYWVPAGVLVIAGGVVRCTRERSPLPRPEVGTLVVLGYLTYFASAGHAPALAGLACAIALAVTLVLIDHPGSPGQSLRSTSSRVAAYRRARER